MAQLDQLGGIFDALREAMSILIKCYDIMLYSSTQQM